MKVWITGTGMEGELTLTAEARKAVEEADILIGAERMTRPYSGLGKPVFTAYRSEDIAAVISREQVSSAAVLMSGDTGFFSGTKKLLPLLEGHDVRVIAGISSLSYFCGLTGQSYEDMRCISLHGRDCGIAVNVKLYGKCFFLLGGDTDAAGVCRRLTDYGLGDSIAVIGQELGSSREKIFRGTARELADIAAEKLCVMTVSYPDRLRYLPSAMDDSEFIRENIPMTKSAVRGSAVSWLRIEQYSTCWDIGCGTGSVSVEMAYRCPMGRVYAFDKKPEAAALTEKNARKHGCDNIVVTEGSCPEILEAAPAPDKVFIGGSSGRIEEIFAAVRRKTDCADVVVTAVSLETLEQASAAFREYGAGHEITQIAVTETSRIAGHTMLHAQNPVFIIRGRLP